MDYKDIDMHNIPDYKELSDIEGDLKDYYDAMKFEILWLHEQLRITDSYLTKARLELHEAKKK